MFTGWVDQNILESQHTSRSRQYQAVIDSVRTQETVFTILQFSRIDVYKMSSSKKLARLYLVCYAEKFYIDPKKIFWALEQK